MSVFMLNGSVNMPDQPHGDLDIPAAQDRDDFPKGDRGRFSVSFLLTQFGKTDKIKHKKKQHIDRERGIIDASYRQEKEL